MSDIALTDKQGQHIKTTHKLMNSPDILYLDRHLFVICKPAGWLVQGDITGDISLLDWGRTHLKSTFNMRGEVYIGLVHRLDRPASGVIVLARTSKAAARLSEQFRTRYIRKIYWALVQGKVSEEGRFVDGIVRKGATSYLAKGKNGQHAELGFRRLGYRKGVSWVEIELTTGRHHQIRVQFSGRGHPLIGDFRYGSKTKFGQRAVALHAQSLTLTHPTRREEMTFVAEPEHCWLQYLVRPTKVRT